ncbi:MAG: DUF2182 domain-containing protein [Mycobacterium sp.]|nr:DUF2182 domain-containing protein [Mycobacterium sp.]
MVALFALGVMSLTWMLAVSGLIAAEKLLPWRRVATAGVSVLLLAVATGVAVAPASVPRLTIPMAYVMAWPPGSAPLTFPINQSGPHPQVWPRLGRRRLGGGWDGEPARRQVREVDGGPVLSVGPLDGVDGGDAGGEEDGEQDHQEDDGGQQHGFSYVSLIGLGCGTC